MDFRLPELGEGVYEAELVRWLVKPGDVVRRGQSLLEVMTDKATMEVPAPFTGKISSVRGETGRLLKVGDVVLVYEPVSEETPTPERKAEPTRGRETPSAGKQSRQQPHGVVRAAVSRGGAGSTVKAAPSVRLLARKLGIDLQEIVGSGPGGRILIEDLTPRLAGKTDGQPKQPSVPDMDYGKPGTRVKLQGMRRKIADHMVQSKRIAPHYSYVDECDVSELVRLRDALKERFAAAGVKLTYLPFFVKAAAAALREVPIVNSTLDEEQGEIILHEACNIGVAVAASAGLIVPVIRDADKKSLVQIARELERLSRDARGGKIRLEDLRGGGFTITSIGNIGGLISTPILNYPEVGILGIGKIVKQPVFDARGQIKAADMVYLSFSFDHRVLDGAIGAVFGNAVMRHVQSPALLLLDEQALT